MDGITLEEATLDQIMDELAKRYEAVVLSFDNRLTKNQHELGSQYRGGLTLCIGLANRVHHVLLRESTRRTEHEGL